MIRTSCIEIPRSTALHIQFRTPSAPRSRLHLYAATSDCNAVGGGLGASLHHAGVALGVEVGTGLRRRGHGRSMGRDISQKRRHHTAFTRIAAVARPLGYTKDLRAEFKPK